MFCCWYCCCNDLKKGCVVTLAKKQTRPPSYRNGAGVTEFLNDGSTTGDGLESKEQQKGHHKTE